MKKLFLALTLMLFTLPALSFEINSSGLTEEQIAQLRLQAAQMKSATDVTPQVAQQWAEVGQAVGVGLVATAKELGVAADDLLTTTTGKLAVAVIIYKVVGQDVVGIIFGMLWLMTLVPVWIYFYGTRGSRHLRSVEEYDKGAREDGKRKIKTYTETSGELKFMYFLGLIILVIPAIIAIFA